MSKDSLTVEQIFQQKAGPTGTLSFAEFTRIALFHPECGYYARKSKRVGREKGTDFYTASSLGLTFKKLVVAACERLLKDQPLGSYHFVEIGAEPEQNGFESVTKNFKSAQTLRLSDKIKIPDRSVVFSNELLDAQPFHRFLFHENRWHELGVQLKGTQFKEIMLPIISKDAAEFLEKLPQNVSDGYILDISLAAESLTHQIISGDWKGLILFFDYGMSWENLIHERPQGTARAYYKQSQHNDLLANPGKQDLTCHVCWDRISRVLESANFNPPKLERQEAFFMHHSIKEIERIISQNAGGFDPERQTLQELIHPAHMGHKFQVLWAKR